MKKNLTLERHNEFDIFTKFKGNTLGREAANDNIRQLTKMPTTKQILEKREKNQGIKIFKEELNKNINRDDGIYKSPKVKVFDLPDSKRVFNKDANYQMFRNTFSPSNTKVTNNTTTTNYQKNLMSSKNKTEKNVFSIENMSNFSYNTRENNLSPNNKPAGYLSPENCDNFNKRNLGQTTFSQHGFTTQITTIPGGVKRQTEEIRDDRKAFRKTSQSFLYKLSRDFSTKETNEFLNFKEIKQKKMFLSKRKSYDCFNKNSDGNYLNKTDGFNSSSTTKYKYSKKVEFNNKFPEKKERCFSKHPRPNNIKNAFESQIVFC